MYSEKLDQSQIIYGKCARILNIEDKGINTHNYSVLHLL